MNKLIEKIKAAGNKLGNFFVAAVKNPDVTAGIITIVTILTVALAMALQDAAKMKREGRYFQYEKFCMDGKIVYLMENRAKDVRQFYVSNKKCISDKNQTKKQPKGI